MTAQQRAHILLTVTQGYVQQEDGTYRGSHYDARISDRVGSDGSMIIEYWQTKRLPSHNPSQYK